MTISGDAGGYARREAARWLGPAEAVEWHQAAVRNEGSGRKLKQSLEMVIIGLIDAFILRMKLHDPRMFYGPNVR